MDNPVSMKLQVPSQQEEDAKSNTMAGKSPGLLETLLAHLKGMKLKSQFDHTQTVAENDQQ